MTESPNRIVVMHVSAIQIAPFHAKLRVVEGERTWNIARIMTKKVGYPFIKLSK